MENTKFSKLSENEVKINDEPIQHTNSVSRDFEKGGLEKGPKPLKKDKAVFCNTYGMGFGDSQHFDSEDMIDNLFANKKPKERIRVKSDDEEEAEEEEENEEKKERRRLAEEKRKAKIEAYRRERAQEKEDIKKAINELPPEVRMIVQPPKKAHRKGNTIPKHKNRTKRPYHRKPPLEPEELERQMKELGADTVEEFKKKSKRHTHNVMEKVRRDKIRENIDALFEKGMGCRGDKVTILEATTRFIDDMIKVCPAEIIEELKVSPANFSLANLSPGARAYIEKFAEQSAQDVKKAEKVLGRQRD